MKVKLRKSALTRIYTSKTEFIATCLTNNCKPAGSFPSWRTDEKQAFKTTKSTPDVIRRGCRHSYEHTMSTTIVHQENAAALSPGVFGAGEKDIALVYMPWGSVSKPSIALGILKQCAKNAWFTADVLYLNLKFADMVGFEMYEHINGRSAIYPEWFFSALLFGHD